MEHGANSPSKMASMPVPKLVISMALPFMLSLLIQNLYNTVDCIFVSRISETALAATSLAYPIQVLFVAISVGIGVGVNALISKLLGENRPERAGTAAAVSLILGTAFALIFALSAVFFINPIVSALTNDPNTALFCHDYLFICMLFCVGQFIEIISLRFMQASGKMLLSMYCMIIGAAVNLALDPILIFGLFGLPALGVRGAAIATVTGQWCGAAAALIVNHHFNPEVRPSFRGFQWDTSAARTILRIGVPTMIMHGMNSVMNFSMNRLLLPVSATAVAFFGVYFKLQNFLNMPLSGLGQAAIPIVGYNYGAGNPDRIHRTIRASLMCSVAIAAVFLILFQLFPAQLLSLFHAGAEMLRIGIPAIRIISLTFLFNAVTTTLGFSVSGLGNGIINMIGTCMRQVVLLIPLAFLFIRQNGLSSVWYSFWISELFAFVITCLLSRHVVNKKLAALRIG